MGDATEHLARRLGIEPDEIVELSSIRIPIRPHLRVREDGQVEHVDAYMREIESVGDLTKDEQDAIGYEGVVQAAKNLAERRRSDEFSARRARDRDVAAFEKQMKRTGRATPGLGPKDVTAMEIERIRKQGALDDATAARLQAETATPGGIKGFPDPNPPPPLDEPGARDADWAVRAQQVDYDTAEMLHNTGQWSSDQFEAYQHLWATSAFRYSSVAQPVVPYEDLPEGVRRYVDMVKPPTAPTAVENLESKLDQTPGTSIEYLYDESGNLTGKRTSPDPYAATKDPSIVRYRVEYKSPTDGAMVDLGWTDSLEHAKGVIRQRKQAARDRGDFQMFKPGDHQIVEQHSSSAPMEPPPPGSKLAQFEEVFRTELDRAIREHPGEYEGMTPDSVPVTVSRIMPAIARGKVNKDTPAMRATFKRLGIRHTYKALQAWLDEGGTEPTAVENLQSKLDIPDHSTRPVPMRMYKKGTVAKDADGHDVVLGPDGVWRHQAETGNVSPDPSNQAAYPDRPDQQAIYDRYNLGDKSLDELYALRDATPLNGEELEVVNTEITFLEEGGDDSGADPLGAMRSALGYSNYPPDEP